MFKRIFRRKEKDKDLITLELAEIKEISDIIFERLRKKIEELKTVEASVDEKIATFKRLNKTGSGSTDSLEDESYRQHRVLALKQRGLEIDEMVNILDIPAGEVELILNLYKDREGLLNHTQLREP